jgi:hypothetical protein
VTTEDRAQAASEAATRATANNRTTFRTPAAQSEGALRRIRFALMSTYAILAQLMEDMLHLQPTEIRQVIKAERKGEMKTGGGSITLFI